MAAWFIPALKAILPHIGIILSAAVPVFTQKNADAAANQTLLQQQIAELQSAVSQNTLHIKELAAQLQSTVAALEEAASIAEVRRQRVYFFSVSALLMSATAFAITLYFFFA